MLIVVGIIGILVALAVPALSTSMSDARKAKVSAYVSQINTALNRYVIDQEVKNQKNAITGLSSDTEWAKIKDYLVINGKTGPSYAEFTAAVCNGGTADIGGGKVEWTTGEGEGATQNEYATVTGVTITCAGATVTP